MTTPGTLRLRNDMLITTMLYSYRNPANPSIHPHHSVQTLAEMDYHAGEERKKTKKATGRMPPTCSFTI